LHPAVYDELIAACFEVLPAPARAEGISIFGHLLPIAVPIVGPVALKTNFDFWTYFVCRYKTKLYDFHTCSEDVQRRPSEQNSDGVGAEQMS
jgi:hypothetical protein